MYNKQLKALRTQTINHIDDTLDILATITDPKQRYIYITEQQQLHNSNKNNILKLETLTQ